MYALISPNIKPFAAEPGAYGLPCSQIGGLPATIDITFTSSAGTPFNLTIPNSELNVGPFASNTSICQTLINAFDGLELVGGSVLKHYYSVWDIANRRMGFAPNGESQFIPGVALEAHADTNVLQGSDRSYASKRRHCTISLVASSSRIIRHLRANMLFLSDSIGLPPRRVALHGGYADIVVVLTSNGNRLEAPITSTFDPKSYVPSPTLDPAVPAQRRACRLPPEPRHLGLRPWRR